MFISFLSTYCFSMEYTSKLSNLNLLSAFKASLLSYKFTVYSSDSSLTDWALSRIALLADGSASLLRISYILFFNCL